MRILLIEDDKLIGDGLNVGLSKLGFVVDWIQNGFEGKEAVTQTAYDAVILDIGLPGQNGISILKEWREDGRPEPVLILTAQGDVNQRILGLESGADDYMSKPFSLKEVAARLNALTRRRYDVLTPIIKHGDITFNSQTKAVFLKNKQIVMSPKETLLYELLLMNKNKVLSKSVIEQKLYSWDDEILSNAIEVHVHNIRAKLGRNAIKTISKIGYQIGDL
ncbi:MAG: response regulator [Elusimicrobiota bacterium]|jgi:two-component system response regulator QseB|nr:response regulator [Elusimicrobiota bacterium]